MQLKNYCFFLEQQTASLFVQTLLLLFIYSLEFFTLGLANGLSLGIEIQQVYSNLQDSSQYSGRFQ